MSTVLWIVWNYFLPVRGRPEMSSSIKYVCMFCKWWGFDEVVCMYVLEMMSSSPEMVKIWLSVEEGHRKSKSFANCWEFIKHGSSSFRTLFELPTSNTSHYNIDLSSVDVKLVQNVYKTELSYSKTPIYRAPIYRVPRFTGPQFFPPKTSFMCKLM